MNTLEKNTIDETLYYEVLDNGLQVYILPKKGFHKTFATFTTNYGSIDNHFTPIGKSEPVKVPDGIAHFLEHKMFEDEEGDVFQTFGKQGASSNAFTSFTKTAYLFSSTAQTEKNISTLLDFVQHPYFTEDSVEKEKGIIEQEIRMYEDQADWLAFFQLLGGMYHEHPAKIDIAGTVASIYDITKEDLYTCYETFYHPSNMALFIAGDADPEALMALIKENQAGKEFPPAPELNRILPEEPAEAAAPKKILEMSVNTPKVLVGYKVLQERTGEELMRYELAMDLLMDTLIGPGTTFYESLYEEGLIDDSFSGEFQVDRSFTFFVAGGDTSDPDELQNRITSLLESKDPSAFDSEMFERIKRRNIGTFLRQLNSLEFMASQYTSYAFAGMDMFDTAAMLESITEEECLELWKQHFHGPERSVSQVIKKNNE